jgi:hypothetical protein
MVFTFFKTMEMSLVRQDDGKSFGCFHVLKHRGLSNVQRTWKRPFLENFRQDDGKSVGRFHVLKSGELSIVRQDMETSKTTPPP